MSQPRPAYLLSAKGRELLRIIYAEIKSGRINPNDSKTFIPYWEALDKLGYPNPKFRSGKRLQAAGLTDLNQWTIASSGIPHVCGLIVIKGKWVPSHGYPDSHGFPAGASWKHWWDKQVADSVAFNWKPYV